MFSVPRRMAGLACAVALAGAASAGSAQQLNVVCSVQAEWCSAVATEFQRETGVKVALTLKGSGESIAQLAAEKANPKLDVWFGGTGDPHLQAAEQDLTAVYKSPALEELQPWAKKQAEQSGFRTVGIYLGLLGFGYNTELLAKKKVAAPACWKDLARPEYAGDVQMANPNASGTAYTAIATLVQLFGEEEAFKLLKGMHRNISSYPRQGVGPIKATARGENLIAVAFIHDVVTEAQAGFPVRSVAPCEGTGYEIGSLSIVKGARNPDAARKFVDWALTAKAQALGAQNKQFQIPSNVNAPISPLAPKLSEVKLIDYNFAKYGASAERKRLLERWDREVGSQVK
jgi:iron(III) transport system substrate-binding protein